MTAAEFVYTVILRPKPLKALANGIIRRLLPERLKIAGAIVVLNPKDPVVSGALTFGVYEKPETKFFTAVCKNGMTFLDVGANIGYYSGLAIARVGPGKVIALEPDPENFGYLQRTVEANQATNTVCCQIAAGAAKGTATLYASSSNRGDNRLYANSLADQTVEVEVDTVDAILDELRVGPVDLIKIDVQGFEGQVVSGMRQTILRSPRLTLLMEFWPFGLESAGTQPVALLEELESLDLKLFELTPKARLVPLIDKPDLTRRYHGRRYTNIVAFRGNAERPAGF
jgi:FkbM family methyltransferase